MNSDKCHVLVAGRKFEQNWTKIGLDLKLESNSVKPTAYRKLSTIARITYYLTFR